MTDQEPVSRDPSRAIIRSAPAPGLRIGDPRDPQPTVYFGIRLDAAVDLLEARESEGLERTQQLRKALDEQRTYINAVLDPSLGLALDLRTRVRPQERTPIQVALIGRVWGEQDRGALTARAGTRQRQLLATLPRHLTGSLIDDRDELLRWLSPFATATPVDAAIVTRREVTAVPSRPDAKVAYYFSVVPFGGGATDWTSVYAALSASPVAIVLSVALLPVELPASLTSRLERIATHYGRLAREDRLRGGLYRGERLVPPDAFAVDAEPAWRDYARRYSGRAFVMRIEIAAEGALPVGVVEAVAGAIASDDREQPGRLEGDRSAMAYEIRRASNEFEQRLARWNLDALDVALLDGRHGIWRRPDPPSADLAALCVLADARDAAATFRMPIAIDGTVPGFEVRRGHFEHAETMQRAHRETTTLPEQLRPRAISARSRSGRSRAFTQTFDVCLSFAGEQREYVDQIASALKDHRLRVFYDQDQDIAMALWGRDLGEVLDYVYREGSRFCLMFISAEYAAKAWTRHERRSALARAVEEDEYVLPARFDDTELPGFRPTIGYVDLREIAPATLVEFVMRKFEGALP